MRTEYVIKVGGPDGYRRQTRNYWHAKQIQREMRTIEVLRFIKGLAPRRVTLKKYNVEWKA